MSHPFFMLQARALVSLRDVEFDLGMEWAFDNAPSCGHWVADRADIELATVADAVSATP